MIKANKKTARIIYKGPSILDGSPIVAVMTMASRNTKTGAMAQVYIIADSDKNPLDINRLGLDFGICGDCKLKGKPAPDKLKGTATERGCYVTLFQGPLIVWKNYRAGKYAPIAPEDLAEYGRGENIRLGAYGDPAAIPAAITRALISKAAGHTGYTHQINIIATDARAELASACMISADNLTEARNHWQAGRRTFRVIQNIDEIVKGEIVCPATAEGGKKTHCNDCRLCSGSESVGKNIAAVFHGGGRGHAARALL